MSYKAGKMVELVSRVEGVREIQNQIEALPVSSSDDQLRAHIARQIYGNVLMPHMKIPGRLPKLSRRRDNSANGRLFHRQRRLERLAGRVRPAHVVRPLRPPRSA